MACEHADGVIRQFIPDKLIIHLHESFGISIAVSPCKVLSGALLVQIVQICMIFHKGRNYGMRCEVGNNKIAIRPNESYDAKHGY